MDVVLKKRSATGALLDRSCCIRSKKGPSMTEQHHKDSCDINVLMKKYRLDSMLGSAAEKNPQFGDFSSVPDFLEAQNIVVRAREQFMLLSADDRDFFHNSEHRFLEYMNDPKNMEDSYKRGLRVRPKQPEPEKIQKVIVVTEPQKDGVK